MIKKPTLAAAGVTAALLITMGLSGRQALAAKPHLTFGTGNVKPGTLPGTGGQATVTVKINALAGATINSVTATAKFAGGTSGPTSTLNATGAKGNTYTGPVTVPANPSKTSAQATISVTVNWSGGTATHTVGKVRVGPGTGDSNVPPPPPPI